MTKASYGAMPEPTTVEPHYTTGLTREHIERALREAGKK